MTTVPLTLPGRPCVSARPLEPSDREAYLSAFSGLSARSRYLRFAAPKPRLAESEIRYLVEVDHHDHEALLAVECCSGEVLGVARFVRLRDDPEAAEVAVTVLDEWQGRGVGSALLERLTERARDEGVRTLVANVLAENGPARRALRRAGFGDARWDDGMLRLTLPLAAA